MLVFGEVRHRLPLKLPDLHGNFVPVRSEGSGSGPYRLFHSGFVREAKKFAKTALENTERTSGIQLRSNEYAVIPA